MCLAEFFTWKYSGFPLQHFEYYPKYFEETPLNMNVTNTEMFYSDITRCFKDMQSTAIGISLFKLTTKKSSKFPITGHLWGESTSH